MDELECFDEPGSAMLPNTESPSKIENKNDLNSRKSTDQHDMQIYDKEDGESSYNILSEVSEVTKATSRLSSV